MSSTNLEQIMQCPSLPSLPAVAVRLLELTADPDVAISDIAKLVQQDQALAAKVLKTVNSSFYGLSTPCGSIDRAMGYLGLNTVKSLVLGFSLVETAKNADDGGFDLESHWRRALVGATAARLIAKAVGGVDPEEVFTASLFQDMGMLACYAAMREEYSGLIAGVPHRSLSKHEKQALGFGHTNVGSELAIKWKLPGEIAEAIKNHHSPDKAPAQYLDVARLVSLGSNVCTCLDPDAPSSSIRTLERLMREWYGKKAPEAEPLLDEVGETAKTLAKMFGQEIGSIPDASMLIARAQEQGFEHQLALQREAAEVAKQALVDGLTKIANRKCFDQELERVYNAFVSKKADFGILFFDADKFKSVNDTYGHAAGDVVLVELARRTNQVIGDKGVVCRYGGEEFAVIIEGMDINACAELGEEVREAIASKPFDLRSVEGVPDELPITVSIGVSTSGAGSPSRLSSGEQVVHEADECVYAAKSDGRNNVKVFGRFNQVTIQNKSESIDMAEPATPKPVGVARVEGRVEKILLIEDDALAATLVISLVKRRSNVEIQWVKSGTKACTMIESGELQGENTPMLILCDYSLPGCDGHEVLRVAKSQPSLGDVPFIMLTGNNDSHMRDESIRRGAKRYIHKDEFCANIKVWLDEMLSSCKAAA